jgi:release factor glutamine methyltransferase
MKVRDLYIQTANRLHEAGVPDGDLEAELLLRFQLDLDRVGLFMTDLELDNGELASFNDLVSRRLTREPLSYITGEKEFWSLPFEVSPAVLIPRPETELLIEKTISLVRTPDKFTGSILDLGTGSGIVPVVLALELPGAKLVSIDISTEALDLAARNISRHGVGERVSLLNSDWFASVAPGTAFDLIVSNPPYVSTGIREDLQPELDFEPELALFAGGDGLEAYKSLIPACREHLKTAGHVLFEIGADQAGDIKNIIDRSPGLELLEIANDLSGLSRVAIAKAVD